MPSPLVETVPEISLIIGRDCPMEFEDTGFPFDDDCDNRAESPFRSQLDDIAARHPEFAQHLGSFPFRSSNRTRTHVPGEHFAQQRFRDRPFANSFEEFGFPFEENREQKPYHQRYPQYYHSDNNASSQDPTGEQSCSSNNQEGQQSDSRNKEEINENLEESAAEPKRGRKPKQNNIQQSNTVDLGQKLEPEVDERSQRSMSAPPSNNRPRFVSSINIPINHPPSSDDSTTQQTAAPSQQPQERVIPIHVEGRDEPVIPRRVTSQNNSHPQQPQAHPCTDKFFTQRSPNFSQYFQREHPFQNDWLPKGFSNKQTNQEHGERGQQPKQSKQSEPSQSKQTQNQQKPMQTEEEAVNEQHFKKQEPPHKFDPIDQIKLIQKDVSELLAQVDQFNGKPKDKQYLYLDEMLTRNLIKLDNIDTQGQENIRLARKEAIKCIEKAISILESKANANVEDQSKTNENMEVDEIKNENTVETENKMEVSTENPQAEVTETKDAEAANEDKTAEQMKETSETEKKAELECEGRSNNEGEIMNKEKGIEEDASIQKETDDEKIKKVDEKK